jgi:2-dehydro-3-deoxygluconokinase
MVKERRTDDVVRVSYYRAGYAGSRLRPEDLDAGLFAGARIVHLTGITLGLSDSCRQAVYAAAEMARDSGALLSFDFNYRSALWDPETAAGEFRAMAARADVVFAGEHELAILQAGADPMDVARRLVADGTREVVVKRGSRGASAVTAAGAWTEPAIPVRAVDAVGAGDALVAGYLSAWLDGADVAARLRRGCAVGAFAVTVMGDWEGLPGRDDLALLGHRAGTTIR